MELRRGPFRSRAVTVSPQGGTVMVVGAKNMAEPRKVTLGAMQGGNWVIQEGLRPGDRVIVSGLQKVQPGQPVRIAKPRSPGSAAKPKPHPTRYGRPMNPRFFNDRPTIAWGVAYFLT